VKDLTNVFELRTMGSDGGIATGLLKLEVGHYVHLLCPEAKGVVLDRDELVSLIRGLIKAQEHISGGNWIETIPNASPA
jgi:hypothetical protein